MARALTLTKLLTQLRSTHLLLEQRVRASFSLTLRPVASKMILPKQFSSGYKRAVSSTIESLHLHGLSRAMTIRRFQSESLLANSVKKALPKSSLMKRSRLSMMNPNIAQPLISDLRSTTRCHVLHPMFRCAEFNRSYSVKDLAFQSSQEFSANSIYLNDNLLKLFNLL